MANTPPIRERSWRTLAALALAPASLIPVALLVYLDYEDVGMADQFFPSAFLWIMALGYVASAFIGAIASMLRVCVRAPLKAGVVVSLFALSAGVWGLLVPAPAADRLFATILFAALSLPVSASYCALAGVRWR